VERPTMARCWNSWVEIRPAKLKKMRWKSSIDQLRLLALLLRYGVGHLETWFCWSKRICCFNLQIRVEKTFARRPFLVFLFAGAWSVAHDISDYPPMSSRYFRWEFIEAGHLRMAMWNVISFGIGKTIIEWRNVAIRFWSSVKFFVFD